MHRLSRWRARLRDSGEPAVPGKQRGQALAGGAPRDTGAMKLQATIVISYRADSFGDAGSALDDVLGRARKREDVEIESVQLAAPATSGPVSLPYVESPPRQPARVPHPLPDSGGTAGGAER
jgi:hypothetical protein